MTRPWSGRSAFVLISRGVAILTLAAGSFGCSGGSGSADDGRTDGTDGSRSAAQRPDAGDAVPPAGDAPELDGALTAPVDAGVTASEPDASATDAEQSPEEPADAELDARPPGARSDAGPKPKRGECDAPEDDLFRNPFNKSGAHHRPIGDGAEYASDSHPSTLSLLKNTSHRVFINVDNGYGFNIYRASAADELKNVRWGGKQTGRGLPVSLRVPDGVQNGVSVDSTLIIFDEEAGVGHEFYGWRSAGPTAEVHIPSPYDGPGNSRPGGERLGTSASGVAGAFGLLRGHEINTPGYKIQHVTQMALSGKGVGMPMQLSKRVVWPAQHNDNFCVQPNYCTGNIPYGALLALPPSVDVEKLGLSEYGTRLARAFQDYGIYVVDNCSGNCIRADQSVSGAARTALNRDLPKIFPRLRMILNNTEKQSASGGGAPRAPNCAFDAQTPPS